MKQAVLKLKSFLGNSWGLTMIVSGIGLSILFGTFFTVLGTIGEYVIQPNQITVGVVVLIASVFITAILSGLASMLTFAGVVVLIIEKVNGSNPSTPVPTHQQHLDAAKQDTPETGQTEYRTNPYDPTASSER